MMLLTKADRAKLLKNGTLPDEKKADLKPVVKFFGGGACTWLITEMDADGDTLFGLADIGHGTPELGYISLKELSEIRFRPFGLGIERDRWWTAEKTLAEYATEARVAGRITT